MALNSAYSVRSQDAPWRRRVSAVLCLLLILSVGRLLVYTVRFARHSLQMDFAAYYTAGEAINRGLTPYQNHVDHDPPLWDGVARYAHSRFLYPPLVAWLFGPLARLPYAAAKTIWTILGLGCVGASLAISAWIVDAEQMGAPAWALVGIATALFHPILTHLERGQIDALTLLILIGSFALVLKGRRSWHGPAAGLLLALATLLKLHIVLILPFLVVRRRWRVTAGYGSGVIFLGLLSMLVVPGLSIDYVFEQLPRISIYGEGGEMEMLVPEEHLHRLLEDVPEGMTQKDGRIYQREAFAFFANATLVRYLSPMLVGWGIEFSVSQLSIGIFGVLFGLLFVWQWWCRLNHRQLEPRTAFLYWQLVLILILLAAPQTWVMNLVWLLPLFVVLLAEAPELPSLTAGLSWCVALAGLALAGVPDRILSMPDLPHWLLYPWGWQWASHKYLLAEVLLLISIVICLSIPNTLFRSVSNR